MKVLAAYFRAKAHLCRELADTIVEQKSPVASELRSLADEFDQNAGVLEDRIAKDMPGDLAQRDAPDFH
jgi:hypothetical protein